ncbi:succinate dehydrogenase/fumarate reductase iron-sulfur subunit [bacterium]|nr:succinate dehydrogenase/fumarate reductase iron-sulfur subunit [bacterium]
MKLTLKIWRQAGPSQKGAFETYTVDGVSSDWSFLEMLDHLNDDLIRKGQAPVAFDSDCREGICGTCGCVVNGHPHGGEPGTTLCQRHMRHYSDGETITIEPWRSVAFPVLRDLIVDRAAFDRIIQAGGYISASTGGAPDGNAIPIAADDAEEAMDAAACIGCGACVAACPNGSAMLFVSAKVSHLAMLPQGRPESALRVKNMVERMDEMGFGGCSNHRECEAYCPKEIPIRHIARMNKEFRKAWFAERR